MTLADLYNALLAAAALVAVLSLGFGLLALVADNWPGKRER